VSGVRGHKAGRPARITPRDLCRVVNPRRQPVRWQGLTSHCIDEQLPLPRPPPPPPRRRAAADAGKHRGRTRHRGTRRDAAPPPASRVDPRAAHSKTIADPAVTWTGTLARVPCHPGRGAWPSVSGCSCHLGVARGGSAGAVERGGLEMRLVWPPPVPSRTGT
jgi:hypothetical protein